MRYDLVVIGSGPAGEKAAAQAAYWGKRVAVIERGAYPGGASVHTVIGNAGAVTPTCNYHRGTVLGGPGQVVTTTFAPGVAGC